MKNIERPPLLYIGNSKEIRNERIAGIFFFLILSIILILISFIINASKMVFIILSIFSFAIAMILILKLVEGLLRVIQGKGELFNPRRKEEIILIKN